MVNRLSARDSMFYFLDDTSSTTHLGSLLIVSPGPKSSGASGARRTLDYPALVSLVENRLQLVPRYRQVVREVTFGLARPVWSDDPDFDINFHIRRAGLPKPGGAEQLHDLVARVMSRPLDRTRALWEMYLIEGLPDGQLAILTKSHRCLVDGHASREISEVICDSVVSVEKLPEDLWMPKSPPGAAALAVGALAEALSRPTELVESLVSGNSVVGGLRHAAGSTIDRIGTTIRQLVDSAPSSPFDTASTSTRIFTTASVPRRGCAKIADRNGCTVNDVELAIISGVMRRWLLSVQEFMPSDDTVRVVLPLSARESGVERTPEDNTRWITVDRPGFVTDLPVGEDNPKVQLAQVAGLANRYAQSSRRVTMGPSPLLPDLGVVPFPELSSRAFNNLGGRAFNVPISMAITPVATRYLAGFTVSDLHVVPTLMSGRALAISVVDYGDKLQFAFIADRGVVSDLPAMADYVTEAFDELLATK